jgi:hypothetical protein
MRTVEIEGKRYLWREVLKLRREQEKQARQPTQETLFELRQDSRPATQRDAASRFENPTLFKID